MVELLPPDAEEAEEEDFEAPWWSDLVVDLSDVTVVEVRFSIPGEGVVAMYARRDASGEVLLGGPELVEDEDQT
jgi:hypothetical protein